LLKEPITADDAPWKQRFRVPRMMVEVARAAPTRALIISNKSGLYELYAFDLRTGALRQVTHRPAGTLFGTIAPDGQYIYYLDDTQGNETGHFVRVPFESNAQTPQDLTPTLPPYSTLSCTIDDTSTHFGLTVPCPGGFESFVIDLAGDTIREPRSLARNTKITDGPFFSHDGTVAVLASTERYGALDFSLIAYRTKNGQTITEIFDESSSIDPGPFSPRPNDQRMLATTNKTGVQRPLIWDPITGTRVDLNVAALEGEIAGWGWSPDGQTLLLCQVNRAAQQLWLYSLDTAQLTKVHHPGGTINAVHFQSNDTLIMRWQDSATPPQLITLSLTDPPRITVLLESGPVPKSRRWHSVTFRSSDGQEIQGWVAVPEGTGPFPAILETHGGPTAAQFETFYPRSQAWLDHGFVYFTINYRGSTTFGKAFEKKIHGDLGHWEVDDLVAARQWLVTNKIARPDQVFLTGWSYGGYLTLQAMGLHPELWAGGMGGVVVADWVTQYEDESAELRGYDLALFGGSPDQKRDAYVRASPITYVERLAAPVLIIQGRSDTRDPPRQVELYETKARALGKNVQVEWFDTGHAGSTADVRLAITHQELMLRWAHNVLQPHRQ
jgi:dipeptidyl aminopeptidase/acylaminoacyl peptidase